MNKVFDICFWCKYLLTDNDSITRCNKHNNVQMYEKSESCDIGELSKFTEYYHLILRIERVEHGGTRESEFFE